MPDRSEPESTPASGTHSTPASDAPTTAIPQAVPPPRPAPPAAPPSTSPPPSEAPTTVIPHATRAAPTRVGAGAPQPGAAPGSLPAAAPVRVPDAPPAPSGKRRWPLVVGAVVGLAAIAAGGYVLVDRLTGDRTEDEVRTAITGFVDAIDRGDLAALRAGSCGDLAAYYAGIGDGDFAGVYQAANSDRAVPVLDSVDAISVTDGTALAQVTVHTANDPASTSVRSFALEQQDGVWKVCS
ncbi:hypothetical protein ACFWQG_17530 [Rhodococcus sp. NPDC058532]|uniref:Rv0361 family membrane protein n=1 Tax=Rhodococcus sp. NPDC058532 TaxID=3346540 RepID=UPI0036651749